MNKLNTKNSIPLPQQIKEKILAKIEAGIYIPEEKLPAEGKIAEEYGVSRLTAREAVIELISEGILSRVPGKGTFVVEGSAGSTNKDTNDPKIVAVIVPRLNLSYYLEIIEGIHDTLGGNDYQLLLSSSNGDPLRERNWLQRLDISSATGLILVASPTYSYQNVDLLTDIALRMPTVVANAIIPGLQTDRVYSDDRSGEYLVTKHMIELGHKKIAHLAASEERLQGYKDALEEFGINFDPEIVRYTKWQFDEGYNETIKLLMLRPDITAIVASNDILAYGANKALNELGMVVPDDMALAGYGNIVYGDTYMETFLTTVDQFPKEMGAVAARFVVEKLTGLRSLDNFAEMKIDHRLIVRNSCGMKLSLGALANAMASRNTASQNKE